MSYSGYTSPIEHAVSLARADYVVLYADRVKHIEALVHHLGDAPFLNGETLIRANGRQEFKAAGRGRIRFLHTASSARGFTADAAFLPDHIRRSSEMMSELYPSLQNSTIPGGSQIYALHERVE